MYKRGFLVSVMALAVVLSLALSLSATAASAPLMSTDELNSRLGESGPLILDVRSGGHWNKSDEKIAGSVRAEPNRISEWADDFARERTIVLYCA